MLQIFWSGSKGLLPKECCLLLEFNKWLKTYFDIACDIEATSTGRATEVKTTGKNKSFLNFHEDASESSKLCMCDQRCPALDKCPVFKESSVDDRWRHAKAKRICFCCLEKDIYWFCKERKVCGIKNCDKKHHNLLHEDSKEELKKGKSCS